VGGWVRGSRRRESRCWCSPPQGEHESSSSSIQGMLGWVVHLLPYLDPLHRNHTHNVSRQLPLTLPLPSMPSCPCPCPCPCPCLQRPPRGGRSVQGPQEGFRGRGGPVADEARQLVGPAGRPRWAYGHGHGHMGMGMGIWAWAWAGSTTEAAVWFLLWRYWVNALRVFATLARRCRARPFGVRRALTSPLPHFPFPSLVAAGSADLAFHALPAFHAGEVSFSAFGVFDGHGGRQVATFASNNLVKAVMGSADASGVPLQVRAAGCRVHAVQQPRRCHPAAQLARQLHTATCHLP